ncbi:MAG: ankyrin repeat domain-containing protein, partial [Terriglobales bacterium]
QQLLRDGAQEDVFSAAALGDTGALRALLARDPALARARDGGSTPLHWAALHCQQSAAMLLMARGADAQARDIAGFTPAQVAVEQGCLRLAQKLDGGASSAR